MINIQLSVRFIYLFGFQWTFWGQSPFFASFACLVGPSGLEPPTSCLSGTRSNLLSYEPMWLVVSVSNTRTYVVEMMGFDSRANCALSHSRLWQLLTVIHFRSYFESLPIWDLNRPSPEGFGTFCVPWWRWWDSNPWPPACRAGALPAELHPHRVLLFLHILDFGKADLSALPLSMSASDYFPAQLPVKYLRHCRA